METVYSTALWDKQNETCIRMTRADTVCVELILDIGNRVYDSVWDKQSETCIRVTVADAVISLDLTHHNGNCIRTVVWDEQNETCIDQYDFS